MSELTHETADTCIVERCDGSRLRFRTQDVEFVTMPNGKEYAFYDEAKAILTEQDVTQTVT
jgi:hypothetical protein